MFRIFSANSCGNKPESILNAKDLTLSHNTIITTGTEFILICEDGYSASVSNGTVTCDENEVWLNRPHCMCKNDSDYSPNLLIQSITCTTCTLIFSFWEQFLLSYPELLSSNSRLADLKKEAY